jgi:hypothetical protein
MVNVRLSVYQKGGIAEKQSLQLQFDPHRQVINKRFRKGINAFLFSLVQRKAQAVVEVQRNWSP